MDYLDFHRQWHELGCFSIHQIYAWCPDFNRTNLWHWTKKGFITRLRKEFYAFTDCMKIPDFTRYVANRIYKPSYLSLHTALAFYGMIPEAVTQYTSVTSLKTAEFSNAFGDYIYKSVRPEMMFGYEPKQMKSGTAFFMATPEKALLDLLYLNPFYDTEADMLDLRLDEDFMFSDFDTARFRHYVEMVGQKALAKRAHTLLKAYEL